MARARLIALLLPAMCAGPVSSRQKSTDPDNNSIVVSTGAVGAGTTGTKFTVVVAGQPAGVFESAAPSDAPEPQRGKTVSWVSFDATIGVPVQIKVEPDLPWQACIVRPLSLGIRPTRGENNSAVFTLITPSQISVEFDDSTDPLLVFSNPPSPLVPRDTPGNGPVITFGPGLHDIGAGYVVPPNATVHLAAGAWVRGTLTTHGRRASGITVEGRGVLDGSLIPHPATATDALALINLCGDGITVRGVTLVNAPTYLLQVNAFWQPGCDGSGTVVENVKLIAWHYTSDGIMVGRDSVVRDNFIKCNDDALKLFMGGTFWERNTIWQLDNGQSFMLSWITDTDERNVTVTDCTVIHVEHFKDYGDHARPSVIGAVHGGTGRLSDYSFSNITVEGDVYRAVGLAVEPNAWGHGSTGSIDAIGFAGVQFLGNATSLSLIHGSRAGDSRTGEQRAGPGIISSVHFDDLSVNGKWASSASFVIDPATTTNITFS
eukprot:m.30776 g.30776  ORF g.30776 m.30776 type:complete len:489 (+) comp6836_c0_seq2:56-1522(+)